MLKGIQILSTAPSLIPGMDFTPSCLEVSSLVLSALLWSLNCGTLRLYTDRPFYSFLVENDMVSLWDDGIDITTVESIPNTINQHVFWAAAKLFALRDEPAPVAMVDNDLFFWRDIGRSVAAGDITVLHREDLWECYVPKELLGIPDGYSFDPGWDWEERPCNTAFAFFSDDCFKKIYTDAAICFMIGNFGKDARPSSQMVFAEQRILAMCAKRNGIRVGALIDDPFDENNDCFTHLWGAKARARTNRTDMDKLLSALREKIKQLDPVLNDKINELWPNN